MTADPGKGEGGGDGGGGPGWGQQVLGYGGPEVQTLPWICLPQKLLCFPESLGCSPDPAKDLYITIARLSLFW